MPGARIGIAFVRPLVKSVWANERKSAPPKVWAKMTRDIPTGLWPVGRLFWIATIGCGENLLAKRRYGILAGLMEHTICIPHPRPAPARIWYPIHFPVEVVVVNVEISPVPIAVSIPLATLHGR